jgi:hypothetical protein
MYPVSFGGQESGPLPKFGIRIEGKVLVLHEKSLARKPYLRIHQENVDGIINAV